MKIKITLNTEKHKFDTKEVSFVHFYLQTMSTMTNELYA